MLEDVLSELFTECWSRLFCGSILPDNALRTGVFCTLNNAQINLRTVVLRAVDPDKKEIVFYTDNRSAKIADIAEATNASWLFYDSGDRIQLKLMGEVVVHQHNEIAKQHWNKLYNGAKKSYLAIPAPSTSISEPADGLEYLTDESDLDIGYQNFAVVTTTVKLIEWLSLKDAGHRRAQLKQIDGKWKGAWLIP